MDLEQLSGVVFNIQRFALDDGPGIRTTVFLKGCPLHCAWCSNPESVRPEPELGLRVALCVGCRRCGGVCPRGAITHPDGLCRIDRDDCDSCMLCTEVCCSKALEQVGVRMTVGEVMDVVLRDANYYRRSGGGLTLSGGEPLLQPLFAGALFGEAKGKGIHTTLDTSGYAAWDDLRTVLSRTDLVLYDIKHPDAASHREGTGVLNDRILENLERILTWTDVRVWVRVPVIPGFNDSNETMAELCRCLEALPRPIEKVSLLPFHNLGSAKYQARGQRYAYGEVALPSAIRMAACVAQVGRHGLRVEIGR
jgi:pyruvate formate lyase activating enzyme